MKPGIASGGFQVTEVGDIHHIDRGYVRLEQDLTALGAAVERVEVPDEPR